MIELYTASTLNGWKISIALEEMGLPYVVHPIRLSKGEQKDPGFLALNPNGRIPVIVDRSNHNLTIFESGAILLYLAEKSGKLIPRDERGRYSVIQWLMYQMSGVGPMMGQANVFYRTFPEKIPAAIERYQNESRRLLEVLDKQLRGREFLCGEYSIADIANWCWARMHPLIDVDTSGLDRLHAWIQAIHARPACQRGIRVPEPSELEEKLNSTTSKG